MHKLNVDKNYFTMGTFDVQAKPINIQCAYLRVRELSEKICLLIIVWILSHSYMYE